MKKVLKTLNELEKAIDSMESLSGELEKHLRGKIEFRFRVVILDSDGICILNEDTTDVCAISSCLDQISSKENFTAEDHRNHSI